MEIGIIIEFEFENAILQNWNSKCSLAKLKIQPCKIELEIRIGIENVAL